MIPFMNLPKQHSDIKSEIDEAISRVIARGSFTLGAEVEEFEAAFAEYCGAKYAVGVGSGTDALFLALKAGGVGPGDEVVTAPNTFIATAEAISMCGATPVFVDVDETSYNIAPELIEAGITARTKAIIPVHLYGQPADMEPIMALARQNNLLVVEDACQAHGAWYKGARAGSIGDAGCFSFYPSKNLGALGDGGMVVTNNVSIAENVRLLRNHGEIKKYSHASKGQCSRLHGLQAAVLRAKLDRLDAWNDSRRAIAALYDEILADSSLNVAPKPAAGCDHVYHLYVIRVPGRERVMESLASAGIATGIHYPVPIHLTRAYRDLGYSAGDFPIAEKAADEILSLPIFPELTRAEVLSVGEHLEACLDGDTFYVSNPKGVPNETGQARASESYRGGRDEETEETIMRSETTISRNQNIVSRTIDNDIILVPISYDVADLQFIYTFNEVGRFIWDRIDGAVSFDQILNSIIDHFEIPQEQAAVDLEAFLNDLAEGNLIGMEA